MYLRELEIFHNTPENLRISPKLKLSTAGCCLSWYTLRGNKIGKNFNFPVRLDPDIGKNKT